MSTLAAERLAAVILAGVAKHQAGGHDQHLGGKYDQHALASALASALTADLLKSYNPRQPRDSHGRWTSTGGGAASSPPTPLSATSPGEPDESDERAYALWGAVDEAAYDHDDTPGGDIDGAAKAMAVTTLADDLHTRADSDPQLAAWRDQAAAKYHRALAPKPQLTAEEAAGFGDLLDEPLPDLSPQEALRATYHGATGLNPPDWADTPEKLAMAEAVQLQLNSWAASSQSPRSLALMDAVADRLGSTDRGHLDRDESGGEAADFAAANRPFLAAFADVSHARTQQRLAAAGVSELTLHRGMKWESDQPYPGFVEDLYGKPGDYRGSASVRLNPLSSWSSDPEVSATFGRVDDSYDPQAAGVILSARVPADRVWGMPGSGVGSRAEEEFVVAAGDRPLDVTVSNLSGGYFSTDHAAAAEAGAAWDPVAGEYVDA